MGGMFSFFFGMEGNVAYLFMAGLIISIFIQSAPIDLTWHVVFTITGPSDTYHSAERKPVGPLRQSFGSPPSGKKPCLRMRDMMTHARKLSLQVMPARNEQCWSYSTSSTKL